MAKYIRNLFLALIITGTLFLASASAAPVVSFFGNFSYAGDTGELSVAGTVTNTNDPSLIAQSDQILFTSTWNGTTFTETQLNFAGGTLLLAGTQTSFLIPIPPDTLSIIGTYSVSSGLWATEFSPIIDFVSTLGLGSGQVFTGMDKDYFGTMTTSLQSRALPTPVPASLTLLGLGLVAIVGFRRKNETFSR